MLTTVALLVILLGLMVSLARYVRDRSANQLTGELLVRLDDLVQVWRERNGGHVPEAPPVIPVGEQPLGEGPPPESAVRVAARANNLMWVDAMKSEFARSGLLERGREKGGFGDLPIALFDGRVLCDAWGHPIVFMPDQHPLIGMAPVRPGEDGQACFFFSAGPDGKYLTRDDNVYSYEQGRK